VRDRVQDTGAYLGRGERDVEASATGRHPQNAPKSHANERTRVTNQRRIEQRMSPKGVLAGDTQRDFRRLTNHINESVVSKRVADVTDSALSSAEWDTEGRPQPPYRQPEDGATLRGLELAEGRYAQRRPRRVRSRVNACSLRLHPVPGLSAGVGVPSPTGAACSSDWTGGSPNARARSSRVASAMALSILDFPRFRCGER